MYRNYSLDNWQSTTFKRNYLLSYQSLICFLFLSIKCFIKIVFLVLEKSHMQTHFTPLSRIKAKCYIHSLLVGTADSDALIWPLGREDERLEKRNDCQMYLHWFLLLHYSSTCHSQWMEWFLGCWSGNQWKKKKYLFFLVCRRKGKKGTLSLFKGKGTDREEQQGNRWSCMLSKYNRSRLPLCRMRCVWWADVESETLWQRVITKADNSTALDYLAASEMEVKMTNQ